MATRTIANGGGDWNTSGTWVEGAVPTTADDVVATATSGNISIANSAAGLCRSFDFTGYVGTLTFGTGAVIQVGSSASTIGNCKFVAGMTVVLGNAAAGLDLRGTGGASATLTMGGKTIGKLGVEVAQTTTTWTLQDTLTCTTVSIGRGVLDLNGQTVNVVNVTLAQNTLVRELKANGATLNVSGTSSAWVTNATNLTVTASTAIINFTGASPTFGAGAYTYGTVTFSGGGTITITGAATITTLALGSPSAVVLPAGVTVTTTTTTISEGVAGTPRSIASSSSGSAATLSLGNTLVLNHFTVQDITKASAGSITAYDTRDVSGNTGVTFAKSKKLAGAGVG